MADLNSLTAQEFGRRLRIARYIAGLLQADAAEVISRSRPTIAAIEAGARHVRISELEALAKRYGQTANAVLRREAVHTDLVPRFRALVETEDEDAIHAAKLLNDLAKADAELENHLGIVHARNYPPERGISQGRIDDLAEEHAQELRDWLGLGAGPIANIFSLVEWDLGIRLYQRRLRSGSKIAGLFAYDRDVGACILLNADHRLERRHYSASHELGHFYGTRESPEIFRTAPAKSRDERYADAFARAFLTPRESFTHSFQQVVAGSERLMRRQVILLAHQHRISREACVRRLEELQLVKRGVWDWFKANGGITDSQAHEVLGEDFQRTDSGKSDANRTVPHRTSLMAHLAWKRGLLTEGQLSELLKVSRLEVRQLVDEIEQEEFKTDELLKLPA